MERDDGRVGEPTGLSSSTEPQEGLGGSRFDPSRITERLEQVYPSALQPIVKKATDELYAALLETAEDYFRDNLEWNLKSHLTTLEHENQRMRTELWEVDLALSGNWLTPEKRIALLRELDKAKASLAELRAAIAMEARRAETLAAPSKTTARAAEGGIANPIANNDPVNRGRG